MQCANHGFFVDRTVRALCRAATKTHHRTASWPYSATCEACRRTSPVSWMPSSSKLSVSVSLTG